MFSNKNINKQKKAVAVQYSSKDIAPKVIAQGQGYVAEKIIDKAEGEKIPVIEDKALAEDLMNIDLGDYIPPELYEAVAQILVFIARLDKAGDKKYAPKNK